jgi:hypothetical protein
MLSNTNVPWLSLTGEDDHVSHALDAMDIGEDTHVEVGRQGGVETSVKRKRTSSHASPPKVSCDELRSCFEIDISQKEGGRGPSKRHKDGLPNKVIHYPGMTIERIAFKNPSRNGTPTPVGPADVHADGVTLNTSEGVNRSSVEPATTNAMVSHESGESGDPVLSQQPGDETAEDRDAFVDGVGAEPAPMTATQISTPLEIIDNSDVSDPNLSTTHVNN